MTQKHIANLMVKISNEKVSTSAVEHTGPFVDIRDYLENCVSSVGRTEDVKLVKQGTKYQIINTINWTTKFVFEFTDNSASHCINTQTSTLLITTHLMTIEIASFDMKSARNLDNHRNGATEFLHYLGPAETWFCPTLRKRPEIHSLFI